jgi:hypothetical protein
MSLRNSRSQSFEEYIGRLERIARQLRIIGFGLLGCTLANFLTLTATVLGLFHSYLSSQFAAVVFVLVLVGATYFESNRRRGEAIYSEVTDEFHRRASRRPTDDVAMPFRIALKDFAVSMDLPLVPGRYGAATYVAVNLALVISLLYLPRYF